MPGRHCPCVDDAFETHVVHVGVQRGREVIERIPGDAPSAEWGVDVTVRSTDDGEIDVGGPFVQGRRGDRFLYLSWGTVDPTDRSGESFEMFRRAKLHIADAGEEVLRDAVRSGTLVCKVKMTDDCGNPTCAHVRAPNAVWSAG